MSITRMTSAERNFLAAIAALTSEYRIPPTLREIAAHMGHTGSQGHLCYLRECLEAYGYLTYIPGAHRSILLTQDGERSLAGGDAC